MPHDIKNNSHFPLDIPTLAGPRLLPAHGTLKGVELSAMELEVLRHSPDIEFAESKTDKPQLDHDDNGKAGGSKKRKG